MKIKSIACFLSLFSLFVTSSTLAQEFDIRRIRWGMSPDEVRQSEDTRPLEVKKEGMVFQTTFLDTPTLVTYFFADNKVVAVVYFFKRDSRAKPVDNGSADEYLQSFAKLESMMDKKYGDPIPGNAANWSNDKYKNNPDKLGVALKEGHVKFISNWETPTTEIRLALGGGNNECALAAVYNSIELAELINKQRKLKEALALDDL